MVEVKDKLQTRIENLAKLFLDISEGKEIQVISHHDTDGITSAAIMIQALKKLDKNFSIKIIKSLDKNFIFSLPKNKITILLDLGSNNLNDFIEAGLENVFIIDHHEITQEIPSQIKIANPEIFEKQKISGSGLTYLFCKELDESNKEFAKLAILGMIGDRMEKGISKLNNGILDDGEIIRKRGLLIYPATRPINRTLEYSSNPFIPGVTGDSAGVFELLREVGLTSTKGKFKSLMELEEDEMEKLVTAIMLRSPKAKHKEIVGDIFLIKLYNKLEDAREISAKINACSRLGKSDLAIQFCMECSNAKKQVETTHSKYKQHIVSGLKEAVKAEKKSGKGFIIINVKNKIKDTMIGTISSILSSSAMYEEGTIIVGMANYEDKIKVSARSVGNVGRNLREILAKVVDQIGGEVGGHEYAAGCNIHQSKEKEFIDNLQKHLEIEVVKV